MWLDSPFMYMCYFICRNFPTKENIQRKKAQLEEMEERGERIPPDSAKITSSNHGKMTFKKKNIFILI